MCENINL